MRDGTVVSLEGGGVESIVVICDLEALDVWRVSVVAATVGHVASREVGDGSSTASSCKPGI